MSFTQFCKIFFSLAIVCLAPCLLHAKELKVKTPAGEVLGFEIEPQDSFENVVNQINSVMNNGIEADDCDVMLDYSLDVSSEDSHSPKRDYYHRLTKEERDDIRYVIKTLAKSSWTQLLQLRSSLKRTEQRILHVHPYRFVECIFTDEELKAGLHSIKDRKLIWGSFYDGLHNSLSDESEKNNLKPEFLEDFAKIVKVDVKAISGPIQKKDWNLFIQTLLKLLPRSGNPDRYDM